MFNMQDELDVKLFIYRKISNALVFGEKCIEIYSGDFFDIDKMFSDEFNLEYEKSKKLYESAKHFCKKKLNHLIYRVRIKKFENVEYIEIKIRKSIYFLFQFFKR